MEVRGKGIDSSIKRLPETNFLMVVIAGDDLVY